MNHAHPVPCWIVRRCSGKLPFMAERFTYTPDGLMTNSPARQVWGATLAEVRIEVLTWFRSINSPAACVPAEPDDETKIETWL